MYLLQAIDFSVECSDDINDCQLPSLTQAQQQYLLKVGVRDQRRIQRSRSLGRQDNNYGRNAARRPKAVPVRISTLSACSEWTLCRSCSAAWNPIGTANLGGIGSPVDHGPAPGENLMVFIVTDTQGMYGSQCPECTAY